MTINIPNPNIHPEVAVNQHLVPRCYMREWSYNGGRSVWTFNKEKQFNKEFPEKSVWKIESRKTKRINAIDNFHDLKAGSLYMPEDALNEIFGFLKSYIIRLNGEQLDTLEKLNQRYSQYSDWEIMNQDGTSISYEYKEKIEKYLMNSRYTYIETEWARKYENNWRGYISDIEQKVRILKDSISVGAKEPREEAEITQADIDLLMKYLIIYDWRSFEGNEYFNEIVECIKHAIPELQNIEVPEKERIHLEDASVMDEIIHNIRLKYFIEFLKYDRGVIRAIAEEYKKNLEICFCLTDSNHPFITSNTPAFVYTREDGMKEHILVARPTMLVSLGKGSCNQFIVSKLSCNQVDKYNQGVAKHGELLILPTNNYNVSMLLNGN